MHLPPIPDEFDDDSKFVIAKLLDDVVSVCATYANKLGNMPMDELRSNVAISEIMHQQQQEFQGYSRGDLIAIAIIDRFTSPK